MPELQKNYSPCTPLEALLFSYEAHKFKIYLIDDHPYHFTSCEIQKTLPFVITFSRYIMKKQHLTIFSIF